MSEDGKPAEEHGSEVVRASSQFLGHGMTFAVLVALFGWIGFKIGARFGAESLLMLVGMLLGGAVGFYSLYVQIVIRRREEQGSEETDDA